MTSGKKALSAIPRNHRIAQRPLKLKTATTRMVQMPKVSIMHGSTMLGPNFFPKRPRKGAVKTYGTKKMLRMRLYWFPWRLRVSKCHTVSNSYRSVVER